MPSRVKAIQNRIVMRNNLLKSERARVRCRVSVARQNHVISHADRAPHRGINAVLRHASADHKLLAAGGEFRLQSRLKERIAGAFVYDLLARLGSYFRSQLPPWSSALQPMPANSIMLHKDHSHGRPPRTLDQSRNARHRLIERLVDLFLADK